MADAPRLDIDYVAHLARLTLTPAEKEEFGRQLAQVLGYIEQLRSVPVDGVEPMAHATPVDNVWQADEPCAGLPVDAALRNAPARRDQRIAVPRVVE